MIIYIFSQKKTLYVYNYSLYIIEVSGFSMIDELHDYLSSWFSKGEYTNGYASIGLAFY